MSTDIQQAALSYFGLPDNARMVEGGAVGEFAFCIGPLTEEQMRGIADRMKAMAEPLAMSEGAGGREVVHVDAPVDDQDAMPGAVWVQAEDFEDYQLPLASDQRTVDWCVQYLLQEALLTDKQRAKYVKGGA